MTALSPQQRVCVNRRDLTNADSNILKVVTGGVILSKLNHLGT